ncbi:C-type lectin domain family 3 member A-like [Cloeon dipterum]|uniref:C-type lectin domain family 3 member A-like n=1 Tax=Cloeon dipterum TaxID=197152 RepID=UPI00321F6CCD
MRPLWLLMSTLLFGTATATNDTDDASSFEQDVRNQLNEILWKVDELRKKANDNRNDASDKFDSMMSALRALKRDINDTWIEARKTNEVVQNMDKVAKQKSSCEAINSGLPLTTVSNRIKYYIPALLMKHRLTWYQARDFCANNSMYLASPRNQHELNRLYDKIKDRYGTNTHWWLSASDVNQTAGDFKWHNGRAFHQDNSMWYNDANEPNSFGKGHEACVNLATSVRAKLNDDDCADSKKDHYFVCEVPEECYGSIEQEVD